jgi:hypothetical protein
MKRLLPLALLAIAGAPLGTPAAEPVTPEQAAKLFALIKPQTGEEKWQQIPWTTDLWAARQRAAKEGKPILLWEMDGHPLACT